MQREIRKIQLKAHRSDKTGFSYVILSTESKSFDSSILGCYVKGTQSMYSTPIKAEILTLVRYQTSNYNTTTSHDNMKM